jgi:hypothetical protein
LSWLFFNNDTIPFVVVIVFWPSSLGRHAFLAVCVCMCECAKKGL